ncbi:MAG: hypothetical protein ABUS48_05895 [Pseudomonadota bacterium]
MLEGPKAFIGKARLSISFAFALLLIIVVLQSVTIWLLLTRQP